MRTILILAALTACTGSPNYWVAYTPTHGTRTTTMQRATIAVTDAGREVESSDNGVIVTKPFTADGPMRDVKFRIRVVVSETGYDIAALCERDGGGDCGDKRPRFVLDTMAKIEGGL